MMQYNNNSKKSKILRLSDNENMPILPSDFYASFLTNKQVDYLQTTFDSWLNIIEGGKRAGKNIIQAIAFCLNLERHRDKLHLVSGFSESTALLNAIDCNGYGIMKYFEGRSHLGKYNKKIALHVDTALGKKIILIAGGGRDGDEKRIQGNSYGMALITEVNLCKMDFIDEVMARTLASSNRKIFHDFNPKGQNHYYYKDFLNVHEDLNKKHKNYGLNYTHLTIADNKSISQEALDAIVKTYDKDSLVFQRDILGLRVESEGLVYKIFAEDKNRWLIRYNKSVGSNSRDTKDTQYNRRYSNITIGVDFGQTSSKTVFIAVGLFKDGNSLELHTLEEHYVENKGYGIDNAQIAKEHYDFYKMVVDKYHSPVPQSYTDHLQTTINDMRKYHRANKSTHYIDKVDKHSIHLDEYIRLILKMFNLDNLKINAHCHGLIQSLSTLLYDEKKDNDSILDNGTTDVDSYDAFRYAISCELSKF